MASLIVPESSAPTLFESSTFVPFTFFCWIFYLNNFNCNSNQKKEMKRDPDQTSGTATSDLGMHYLPITLLGLSRLQWVNKNLRC